MLCPCLIFWTMLLTLLNPLGFLTHLPPTFSWEKPPHLWIPHSEIWITIWIYFHVYYYCRDVRWGRMDTLDKWIQHNEGHFQLWLPIIPSIINRCHAIDFFSWYQVSFLADQGCSLVILDFFLYFEIQLYILDSRWSDLCDIKIYNDISIQIVIIERGVVLLKTWLCFALN